MASLMLNLAKTMAAAAALSLLAAPALGQIKPQSEAPIDVTADEAEVVNSRCLAIWRGAAEALQADSRLRANTINVYAAVTRKSDGGVSCGATSRIEAEGDVYYVTPEETVKGDRAVYDASSDTLVVTGEVIIAQDRNVARGTKLTVNMKTREAQMETEVKGRNQPGRVRGVFYPGTESADRPAS